MDIIVGVTVFLGLTLLWMGLLYCEDRAHDKRIHARMAALAPKPAYKPLHIEV